MNNFKIIIITGLSGSGKSTALAAFEDAGFYCVDNMPVVLLPKFLQLPLESGVGITGYAFVMDLREKDFLLNYPATFELLLKGNYDLFILFLEADENILLHRYSQTRRHHPLSQGKGILEGIQAELKKLDTLRKFSDKIINTSNTNVHELKSIIFGIAKDSVHAPSMNINIMSFGFKYGIPQDADLIMDVRFVTNPYFVPELKMLNGENEKVRDYVLGNEKTHVFLKKYLDLLDYLIPLYKKEGKAYLTIAVGCTGGRHRSVVISRAVYGHIKKLKESVEIIHRDIGN